ncbi:MAG: hypothetical protein ABR84_02315 [Cryomorphaceae bacterium BACL21 MAG-121220-bin10]|nr:MAG: hypothetical protein ABR84_02315 [Cryomorphaceae bacterium BACL21 MAG-121220-bin10]
MQHLSFRNQDSMPALGLGTWKAQGEELIEAIIKAVTMGYRHIDTAMIYHNEHEIGQAIKQLIDSGVVTREELFVTSKLWNDAHLEADVATAAAESLGKLGLDYLDLYLIHWPIAFKHTVILPESFQDYHTLAQAPLHKTWQAMEALKASGRVKHIGVSNFTVRHLEGLAPFCKEFPEVNQVELHPLLQQESLLEYCQKHNILLTAYAPLGSGDRHQSMKAEQEPNLFAIKQIHGLAQKYDVTPGQILISWHLNRGCSVIPKAMQEIHLEENYAARHIVWAPEDLASIKDLDQHYRFINGHFFDCPEQGYGWVFA